ncbi:mucin-5AC [Aplysia californica]|uniref:protein-tyrosine-phosphatase n=1 Tax=Aplysia californica TaxID=6500 RepID=A0ABM1AG51_APLCA|nr:mucin-5AC [Aplysia californica]
MVILGSWSEQHRRTQQNNPSPAGSAHLRHTDHVTAGTPLVVHTSCDVTEISSTLYSLGGQVLTMAETSAAGEITPAKSVRGTTTTSTTSANSNSNSNSNCPSPVRDDLETQQQTAASASARSRRKFARSGSNSWFNKSFDQAVLNQATKPPPARSMRRQSSVTDFFQNVLSKSKSHLQDIFSSKREKSKIKMAMTTAQEARLQSPTAAVAAASDKTAESASGAEGGASPAQSGHDLGFRSASLHKSCPSFYDPDSELVDTSSINVQISLDPSPTETRPDISKRRRSGDKSRVSSPTSPMTATMNMFVVTKPTNFRSKSEDVDSSLTNAAPTHRRLTKKSSLPFSTFRHEGTSSPTSISSLTSPSKKKTPVSDTASPGRYRAPKIVTLSSHDSSDSADESQFRIGSFTSTPPGAYTGGGRASFTGTTALLTTGDVISRAKRALVKSNSDTFAKLSSSPLPLVKASSDGNCFKKNSVSSLATSMTSSARVMVSVTDYLFLGSVEAAYNEPLLCKYGVSSMIDMTNISPTLVPPHKKSDCPCACVNKTHFRSKLNIGVDDIEWENLEQYFEEINAFINGARLKGRRVLVYSYMGQSRAAAAAIQHLMHHFKMPYREALHVVRSKRPQVKLNSGFVKALLRLEKRLGLQTVNQDEKGAGLKKQENKPEESPRVSRGSVEDLSAPPVVRGAWLEC